MLVSFLNLFQHITHTGTVKCCQNFMNVKKVHIKSDSEKCFYADLVHGYISSSCLNLNLATIIINIFIIISEHSSWCTAPSASLSVDEHLRGGLSLSDFVPETSIVWGQHRTRVEVH